MKKVQIQENYELNDYDAKLLAADKELADFFEEVVKKSNSPKLSANWVMGEFLAELNKNNLSTKESKVSAKQLGTLIARIERLNHLWKKQLKMSLKRCGLLQKGLMKLLRKKDFNK